MATFQISRALFDEARGHLHGGVEQVGFFLAETESAPTVFNLRAWRAVRPEGFERQGPYHVTLTDKAKCQVIRWASDAGASLVEAHSHIDFGPAEFSPSDLRGFRDWVPHLFWRLRGKPYAALTTAGPTFDGLAWFNKGDEVEQVDRIDLDDGTFLPATGRTLRYRGNLSNTLEYTEG